ncbi:MAG: hypothetical protein ACKOU7_11040, partial [Ferruginibacter sp.]
RLFPFHKTHQTDVEDGLPFLGHQTCGSISVLCKNPFHHAPKDHLLMRMFDDPRMEGHLPRPFGVFYETERACYEDSMTMQIDEVIAKKGKGDLDKLLRGNETWVIN